MYNRDQKNNHSAICDNVPGFAYYDNIGYSLGEKLVDLFEWLLGFPK